MTWLPKLLEFFLSSYFQRHPPAPMTSLLNPARVGRRKEMGKRQRRCERMPLPCVLVHIFHKISLEEFISTFLSSHLESFLHVLQCCPDNRGKSVEPNELLSKNCVHRFFVQHWILFSHLQNKFMITSKKDD